MHSITTIVCGLWDLSDIPKQKFAKLFSECKLSMCIYLDPANEEFIWKYREKSNTRIFHKKLDDFKTWFEFYSLVQKTNGSIELSKMFMLHDVKIHNPFNSSYFYWMDSDIDIPYDMLSKLPYITNNQFMTCTHRESNNAKLFGGIDTAIKEMNNLYYGHLKQILTEKVIESCNYVFTVIARNYTDLIYMEQLDILREKIEGYTLEQPSIISKPFHNIKTHLYVLTYNSPSQFEYLLNSFEKSDNHFLKKPSKFLLNNSTDRKTDRMYDELCLKYGFEQIKKDNIGICRGRQFVAEHFDASDADYYIFFEDDMLLHIPESNGYCQNGFRKWVNNMYEKTLKIMHREKYDYLKLNFTEVYGGNEIQWAWYNIPDDIRHKHFPNKKNKPVTGLDPNPPLTQFGCMKRSDDITYIEGEIYYCNWPLWFNREGNRKVFLEPKFAYPFEQTWMSLVFQKQKANLFNVAVLLLSPINHDRIHYYAGEERREN